MMTTDLTDIDATDDKEWFVEHPNDDYRLRTIRGTTWLIRRIRERKVADVLLRVRLASPPEAGNGDSDDLRTLWFERAWPDIDADVRKSLIAKARAAEARRKKK
jgi:hypothetical protein